MKSPDHNGEDNFARDFMVSPSPSCRRLSPAPEPPAALPGRAGPGRQRFVCAGEERGGEARTHPEDRVVSAGGETASAPRTPSPPPALWAPRVRPPGRVRAPRRRRRRPPIVSRAGNRRRVRSLVTSPSNLSLPGGSGQGVCSGGGRCGWHSCVGSPSPRRSRWKSCARASQLLSPPPARGLPNSRVCRSGLWPPEHQVGGRGGVGVTSGGGWGECGGGGRVVQKETSRLPRGSGRRRRGCDYRFLSGVGAGSLGTIVLAGRRRRRGPEP